MATVIVRDCATYDSDRIRGLVREGIQTLKLEPRGRILVKPNGVIANKLLFEHAYTRPEFLDGVMGALRDTAKDVQELALGERCGITMPTRMVFAEAGWNEVVRKHGAKSYFFEEERQVEVALEREPRLRDYVFTPEPVARADFLVNCPKLKAHPWTTITLALKNYIGIQDDRHRLIDHDHRLDDKIADLQEIAPQRFIAADAIIAGQDRMMTPTPFQLGLVLLADNPVAADVVACHILGIDPLEVAHIVAAAKKGFGPLSLDELRLDGDVTLSQAKDRAKGFRKGLIRVEKYFEGTKITAHAGPPPADARTDYCWGGCPGAIEEAIEIVRRLDANADAKMKPITFVFGAYDGPLTPKPGERVVFIGDCAKWKGTLGGKAVEIASQYVDRRHKDPRHARMDGIFVKMAKVFTQLFHKRREQVLRISGCPVSVAEHTLLLASLGGTHNPYFMPKTAVPFMRGYVVTRMVQWWNRLFRGAPAPAAHSHSHPHPHG